MLENKTTILFDLDGTLLPININKLLDKYFKLLGKEFKDIAPAATFLKILMQATEIMLKNEGKQTNQDLFLDTFFSQIKINDKSKILTRFDDFYLEKFPLLKKDFELDKKGSLLVKTLKNKGYRLVLATNPVFPKLAIQERLNWIDINPADFSLITTYENMHYCKPNLKYYQEIMEKLSVKSQECIMIGNDLKEDMIASKLGITSFLVEDFLIDDSNSKVKIAWGGSMAELIKVLT